MKYLLLHFLIYICIAITVVFTGFALQADIAENKYSNTKLRQRVLNNEKEIKNLQKVDDGFEAEQDKIITNQTELMEEVFCFNNNCW